jgi:hypothetical protein
MWVSVSIDLIIHDAHRTCQDWVGVSLGSDFNVVKIAAGLISSVKEIKYSSFYCHSDQGRLDTLECGEMQSEPYN